MSPPNISCLLEDEMYGGELICTDEQFVIFCVIQ